MGVKALTAAFFLCACHAQTAEQNLRLAGKVVNSVSGEPIAGALVTFQGVAIRMDGFQPVPPVLTDAAGRFQTVASGKRTHLIRAAKQGFLADGQGASMVEPPKEEIVLRLQPLARIFGKVTDRDGEPVNGAAMRAIQVTIADGRRTFREVRSVSTDDVGRYRLWNLAAGEYYLVAAGRSGDTMLYVGQTAPAATWDQNFAPVYYPRGTNRASGAAIVLAPGQQFEANLTVTLQPAMRVRGSLRNAALHQPVQLELRTADSGIHGASVTRALVSADSGRFEIRDVIPGEYVLRASQGNEEAARVAERPVQVGAADLEGMALDLAPGVNVVGMVQGCQATQMDLPQRIEGFNIRMATCQAKLIPVDAGAAQRIYEPDPTGRLVIPSVLPGRYRLEVRPNNGYVASARSGTVDLLAGGELVVGRGVPLPLLEVVVNSDGGTIRGVTPAGGLVLLVSNVRAPMVYLVSGGDFLAPHIPPGDYRAYFLKGGGAIEYTNPEVLRALGAGQAVHVTNGAETGLEFKQAAQ